MMWGQGQGVPFSTAIRGQPLHPSGGAAFALRPSPLRPSPLLPAAAFGRLGRAGFGLRWLRPSLLRHRPRWGSALAPFLPSFSPPPAPAFGFPIRLSDIRLSEIQKQKLSFGFPIKIFEYPNIQVCKYPGIRKYLNISSHFRTRKKVPPAQGAQAVVRYYHRKFAAMPAIRQVARPPRSAAGSLPPSPLRPSPLRPSPLLPAAAFGRLGRAGFGLRWLRPSLASGAFPPAPPAASLPTRAALPSLRCGRLARPPAPLPAVAPVYVGVCKS